MFLQFKRPEYLHGPSAKQWKMWHHPYYRFKRSKEQQQVLGRLERRLGIQAVVRYAAPAFQTMAELEAAQIAGTVVAQSGHVPPARLHRHQWWTYDAAGTMGRPNPYGEASLFERFDALLDEALFRSGTGRAMQPYQADPLSGLREHLQRGLVANVSRSFDATFDSWARQLAMLELDTQTMDSLRDLASIQTLMARTHGAWWVTGI